MKIGFIGLGIMGKPMSINLIKSGYDLVVYDIVESNMDEAVTAGAIGSTSPCEVALESDVIITMLPNSPHVKEVVQGQNGIIDGIKKGSIFIDMSSINPLVSKELSTLLSDKGAEMLDAPVSGGEPKAIDGTLAIMVGGNADVFGKAEAILNVMGGSVTLVGDIGSGNVTKLANQIIVAGNIASMSEALALATKAGVDPQRVYQAIRGGLAGSTVLDAKAPMILDGNFKPGFRIELHIKDLNNALDTSKELGIPTPITDQTMMIMQELRKDGKEKDDHGGMARYYEKLGGVLIRK